MNWNSRSPIRAMLFSLWLLLGHAGFSVQAAIADNLVGYIKLTPPAGSSLLAIPFTDPPERTIDELMKGALPELTIIQFREGVMVTNRYVPDQGWDDPFMTVKAMEAVRLEVTESFSLTLVGGIASQKFPALMQLQAGENWIAAPVPTRTLDWEKLGFPKLNGLSVWILAANGQEQKLAEVVDGAWLPPVASVDPGAGLIVRSPEPASWVLAFTDETVEFLNLEHPGIRKLPSRLILRLGETFDLRPIVDGERPIQIEWLRNGQLIPSADKFGFTVASQGSENAGTFQMRVTDARGQVVTAETVIERYNGPPILRWQFADGRPAGLELYGWSGGTNRLLASPNLKEWTPVQTGVRLPLQLPASVWTEAGFQFFQIRGD